METERVSPLHYPIEEYCFLSDMQIPKFAANDVKLEEMLENAEIKEIEEISKFIISTYGLKNLKIPLHQILYFSNKNTKKLEFYADLLITIQHALDYVINPIDIGKRNGKLLRLLFTKEFYSRKQIKDACENYTVVINNKKTYRPLYFYFAQEFGLYEKDAHYFGIKDNYIKKLKEDDYYLWNEIIENDYETHSVQYAIMNDDEVLLSHWIREKYELDDKIELNSFSGLYRKETIEIHHACALFGAEKCFKYLVDEGIECDANVCDFAAKGGNLNILKMCANHSSHDFTNTFASACYSHNKEAVDFVLSNGAVVCDIKEVVASNYVLGVLFVLGRTDEIPGEALHNALVNEHRIVARILLDELCDVSYKTNSQRSCVHEAAELAYIEILKKLKEGSARFMEPDVVGTVPLHLAVKSHDFECFKFVLNESEKVINALDDFGSPLHYAARYDFEEAVVTLIESGADVNIAGAGGYTPLHIASKKNFSSIVRILKEHGAQMDAKSEKGHTGYRLTTSKYVKGLYN